MTELTREEFASAVAATFTGAHHLSRALGHLVQGLREHLAEEPDPLVFFGGTGPRSIRDAGRLVVRNHYAMLFRPAGGDDEELTEDDEYPEDEEGAPARRRRPAASISASEFLLAVVIAVHDARAQSTFEPHLCYAVLGAWGVGGEPLPPDGKLSVAPGKLRRIPEAILRPGASPGERLETQAAAKKGSGRAVRVRDRRVSYALAAPVGTDPLYDLDSPAALERVSEEMKRMYAAAALFER